MSKTDTMSKTGKFCPFQPPLVDIYDNLDGREPVTEYQWQKCGEALKAVEEYINEKL